MQAPQPAKEQDYHVQAPLRGLRLDVPSSLMEDQFSTNSWNVTLGEEDVQVRYGVSRIGKNLPLDGQVLKIEQVKDSDGTLYTVVFTTEDIYSLGVEQEWESILPEGIDWSPTLDSGINTEFFKFTLLITNGINRPLEWTPGEPEVEEIDNTEDFVFRSAHAFYSRVVYALATENGQPAGERVWWSDLGTYDEFDTFVDLIDTPGRIMGIMPLGESLVIYKRSSIILANYMGGQSVFSFDTRVADTGLISPRGVADIGDRHLFLAHDNVYEFSGGRIAKPIGDAVRPLMPRLIDDDAIERSIAIRHGAEIFFIVPVQSALPDTCYIYNWHRDSWYAYNMEMTGVGYYRDTEAKTIEDLGDTPIGELGGLIGDFGGMSVRPRLVLGTEDGMVYSHTPSALKDDNEPIEAMWDSKDLVFDEHKARINRYRWLEFDARGTYVETYYSTNSGRRWNRIGSVELTNDFEWYRLPFDDSSRQIRIRFYSGTAGGRFALRTFKIRFREGARI